MKNSDLKRMLRSAYSVAPSEKKTAWLRDHRMRELHYGKMLWMQVQYMGLPLAVACGYALAILLIAAAKANAETAGVFAAFLPLVALLALTGLGKSEKYRMAEIEMASRFSLRMIKILRLAVCGLTGVVVMLAVSPMLKIAVGADFLTAFALAAIPYLLTTFFCMLLIRKWHSENNLYGCAAIALAVCAAMLKKIRALCVSPAQCRVWLLPILLVSLACATDEACRYLKESEEYQWNWC